MARGITSADMARVFALGRQPDYADLRALLPGKALGAVRASVGIATTEDDVHRLADFLGDLGSDITRGSHLRPA
jgi:selenocysteine lyase/cysteine desulfurase